MSSTNVVAGRLQHELANYYDNDIILYFGLSEIKSMESKHGDKQGFTYANVPI